MKAITFISPPHEGPEEGIGLVDFADHLCPAFGGNIDHDMKFMYSESEKRA